MALVTTNDVRRWLGDQNVPDSELLPLISTAEAMVKNYTGYDWGATGNITERHYFVRQDAFIRTKDYFLSNPEIYVYTSTDLSTSSRKLDPEEFAVLPGGIVKLNFFANVIPPWFESAVASRLVGSYSVVEIRYTASGTVPDAIREAVAAVAAMLYTRRSNDLSGFETERLGDYSYARRKTERFPESIMAILAPYTRPRITVVG